MIFLRLSATALAAVLATAAIAYEPIISAPGEGMKIKPPGGSIEVLATRESTDGQLGIIALDLTPGNGPGPAIVHHWQSETWYLVEGEVEFHVGDKSWVGGPGTFVSVDAGTPHGFISKTDGKLLVIFQPGGYEQFFIEWDKTQVPPGPESGMLENKYGVTRP